MEASSGVAVKCRGCGVEAPAGGVCPECGCLQPFPPGADHWAVLGLPRRLVLDRADLERRFHALNRRLHPDYFRLRPTDEQASSLENSAAVNAAYRTLRDPVSRVEYLLELEGMALGTSGQARPPADLFEEIMELQEARQELETAAPDEAPALRARLESARTELDARRARMESDLVARLPAWDAASDGDRRPLLGEMRDILATRAYLRTILRDLGATLERTGDGGA
ncbi:MAG: Fe-S protein assembly co-chaperone HscB [Candidatus Rokubacteria bacterium]|nr:Fe-S protein assembly co-chaperone HscB [Candidatus Rokubacteria bacterium]